MNKHCKGCVYHINAGRRHPTRELKKFNDHCAARPGPVLISWCKTHNAKKEKHAT
jgi:hypothetical protein